jgi:2-C-methyl-D-erythritol 4-phosphate cytidylyltransferase
VVVQGSDRNIKITKPSDMDLAQLFLEQERQGEPA